MSHLVLELRPGEMMVVNGATLRFRSRCRVELVSRARFLFGKQIMAPHEAETAIRQLYLQLQTAYVGPVEEQAAAARAVHDLLDDLRPHGSPEMGSALDVVEQAFIAGDHYKALKVLRIMVQGERDDDLNRTGTAVDGSLTRA